MNYNEKKISQIDRPVLSICIATLNRGAFIGETLDSILKQVNHNVEIVVVDGASPDSTPQVMSHYSSRYPCIRYFREPVNSGVDADYDKAVGYASGSYCWLMTDDDLLLPGAVNRVLAAVNNANWDLIVVNSELRSIDFSVLLDERRMDIQNDIEYGESESVDFFEKTAWYLSFIGGVIVNRNLWLSRDRATYYGTVFVHVGVIFQSPPLKKMLVIAHPLISIRHSNSLWLPRAFEIWSFKWPQLIWSFSDYLESSKESIITREPWIKLKWFFARRAMGAYSVVEYKKFISQRTKGLRRIAAQAIAIFPMVVANFLLVLYYLMLKRSARLEVYDLLHAPTSSLASKVLAKALCFHPLKGGFNEEVQRLNK
jgi:glycosyltransferase involved in cell wall biosynthesis